MEGQSLEKSPTRAGAGGEVRGPGGAGGSPDGGEAVPCSEALEVEGAQGSGLGMEEEVWAKTMHFVKIAAVFFKSTEERADG